MKARLRFCRPGAALRRGATAVEFALTAPILFMLVLGAIEFSRANILVHTASIAATEAARKSIVPGATSAEVRQAALDQLAIVGIRDATITTEPADIVEDTPQVTVNLSVPVSMRNGYLLPRVFLGRSVFKSVTLQREGKSANVGDEAVQSDGMQGSLQGEGYGGLVNPVSRGSISNAGGNGNGNAGSNNNAGGNGNGNGNGAANAGAGNNNAGGNGNGNSGS